VARPRKYQVRWTGGAKEDVAAIAAYVSRESGDRAEQLREHLVDAAARLAIHPLRGRVVPELHDFGLDFWRELVVENYRIVYRVEGRRVLIGLVLDGRRDVEHALLERLIAY
jgi:toxin ParE1/3/4